MTGGRVKTFSFRLRSGHWPLSGISAIDTHGGRHLAERGKCFSSKGGVQMTGTIIDVHQRRQQINEVKALAHLSVIAIGCARCADQVGRRP